MAGFSFGRKISSLITQAPLSEGKDVTDSPFFLRALRAFAVNQFDRSLVGGFYREERKGREGWVGKGGADLSGRKGDIHFFRNPHPGPLPEGEGVCTTRWATRSFALRLRGLRWSSSSLGRMGFLVKASSRGSLRKASLTRRSSSE
jgi:hypothetical protein